MDEVKSRERLLRVYMVDRNEMIKLRMPSDEEQLETLMAQKTLPKLIVFLDSRAAPVLIMREGNIQFCAEGGLGGKLGCLLKKRRYGKERGGGRYCG